MGAIFEAPKQSENLEKSEKARQLDARLHPPVSLFPCIKGFLRGIRKKVPKLLYHSLGTNVVAGVGLEPHDLLVMIPVVVSPTSSIPPGNYQVIVVSKLPYGCCPSGSPISWGNPQGFPTQSCTPPHIVQMLNNSLHHLVLIQHLGGTLKGSLHHPVGTP